MSAGERQPASPGARAALPQILGPAGAGSEDLLAWVAARRNELGPRLLETGALLFRGFEPLGVEGLGRFVETVSGGAMEYTDRAARRTHLAGGVYTATDHPAVQEIFLHNESAYGARWPMKLFLHCRRPAEQGGRTPLADVRRVLGRLEHATRRVFAEKGVLYVRNFGTGVFSATWEEAFGTEDRQALEETCRRSGIDFQWLDEHHLRTRAVRPAIVRHPGTHQEVWFNHAAALHVTTLPARMQRAMQRLFPEPDLPTHTYFGDGSPIPPPVIEEVRQAYRRETVHFDWQEGDVLVLDNMLVAHGREPFSGPRDVVVGMSEPTTWDQVEVADG